MSNLGSFIEYEEQRAARAGMKLASHPYIFASVKKWHKMSPNDRIDFLRHYTNLCSDALAGGMVMFGFFERAPIITPNGNRLMNFARHKMDKIFGTSTVEFNNHPEVLALLDLNGAISHSPHEITHRYQKQIIANPGILPERFRADIPGIFEENFLYYINGASDHAAYRIQPVERHAFANQRAFQKSFMEFVNARAFLKNPFDESVAEKEFRSGRVSMPLDCCDPYRHYYTALLRENDQSNPGPAHNKWNAVLAGYAASVRHGEYLIPHNPGPALEKVCKLAENNLGSSAEVPPHIQIRARQHLESFADSDNTAIRSRVKRALSYLDRHGPMTPLVASEREPKAAPQPA